MKRGEYFTPCRDCIMYVGGGCAEGRGNTADEDGCVVTYFYDCKLTDKMPIVPKRFVRYMQPLTDEFFTKNFGDADVAFSRWCTTKEQTPVSIDVNKRRDGKYTVIVYDEVRDNIFNASTVGELVTFLNLCGHNDFVSKLKI